MAPRVNDQAEPVPSLHVSPLQSSASRWLAATALVVTGYSFARLAASICVNIVQGRGLWFLHPLWTHFFFYAWVAAMTLWLIGGLGLLWQPERTASVVRIASCLSALLVINHFMFDRFANYRNDIHTWYGAIYYSFLGAADEMCFLLVGLFGFALERERRRYSNVSSTAVVRWVGAGAVVCGGFCAATIAQRVGENVWYLVRSLNRPVVRDVAEMLLATASVGWIASGIGLLRHRVGASTVLHMSSLLWFGGAVSYLVDQVISYGARDPLLYRVAEALNFLGWFLYGMVFAGLATVALGHDEVRRALPSRARIGFTPILVGHPRAT
jgi:hypothetical protein